MFSAFLLLLLFTLILLHSFGLATLWTSLFIDLRQLQAQLAAAHARVAELEAQAAQDEPLGSEAGYIYIYIYLAVSHIASVLFDL